MVKRKSVSLLFYHTTYMPCKAQHCMQSLLLCLPTGNSLSLLPQMAVSSHPISRQARVLISGPSLGAKAKFLSSNRTQSRAVTGLLTGHNTLRRHLHLMGLSDNPLCRRCAAQDETSAHILCECEALASLRHAYLDSFFLDPEDITSISRGGHLELTESNRAPKN
jgi:hypothetical protein